jgi:hypothetical protein
MFDEIKNRLPIVPVKEAGWHRSLLMSADRLDRATASPCSDFADTVGVTLHYQQRLADTGVRRIPLNF